MRFFLQIGNLFKILLVGLFHVRTLELWFHGFNRLSQPIQVGHVYVEQLLRHIFGYVDLLQLNRKVVLVEELLYVVFQFLVRFLLDTY